MDSISLYNPKILKHYKSNSQRARVLSENWCSSEMYCPSCLNEHIIHFPNNEKVKDFFCMNCRNEFQLKSSSKKFGKRVVDGEFNTLMKFLNKNKAPNFLLMHYSNDDWYIKNLFLVPKFFISPSIIEKRNPLKESARRRGWIGCNIIIEGIPDEGKINIIKNEKVINKKTVNKKWKKMFFLNDKNPYTRGWTTDVLKCIEDLSKREFTLKDIYKFKGYLKELHPKNEHIEAKIRQQLQILRDNNILKFKSRGNYSLKHFD
ncbi:restriction endonuclease [Candidatus Woesearchaeota archaeon]|nr:restriction endonuclease [Candidatus Woesearchaeota archaeon]